MYEMDQVSDSIRRTQTRIVRPRLGIIGGGQLAKMTAAAALRLGCDVAVLERNAHSPAGNMAAHLLVGDWDDPTTLLQLAAAVDVVTLENEFVSADSLTAIEQAGIVLHPSSSTVRLIQDKMLQKRFCDEVGVATARWMSVLAPQDVLKAGEVFGWPLLLKARRNAYDGKGNVTVADASQIERAWTAIHREGGLYVEEFCAFERELAVIVTRGRDGATAVYPVVESVQRSHVCHVVKAPADIAPATAQRAADLARQFVQAIHGVGSFGIEMFLLPDGRVLMNEIAPRVHNSGHYTVEACICSQFENHVRAVFGWPLGSPRMIAPASAMVNLLGRRNGAGTPRGMEHALAVSGASLHLYGKLTSQAGRKMGHVTALGGTTTEALATAMSAASLIDFGDMA